MLKLVDLPVDVLFLIAKCIDAGSIARLSSTCRTFKTLLQSFSNLIYRNIAKRDLNLSLLPRNFTSYHQLVLVHEALRRNHCFPIETGEKKEVPQFAHFLMAWPVHERSAYLIALSGNYLIWVEFENMKKLYVKDLGNFDWEKDDVLHRDYTLRGHTARIGLILANNDGLLVSFDISCDIYVWDLGAKRLERKINTRDELGMIMSMNFQNDRVVCAGINGRIAVWNALNGLLIHSFSIQSAYLDVLDEHQLNVSIYGDLVAFGLSDGKFYIYNISQKGIVMSFDITKEKSQRMVRREQELNAILPEPDNYARQEIAIEVNSDSLAGNNLVETEVLENNVEIEMNIATNEHLEDLQILDEQDNDSGSEDTDMMDLFPLNDSSVPLTLSLSSHFLLTNGPDASCLALWDLREGKLIGFLDDMRISRINRSNIGPLRFAEISADSSMIYSVSGDLMVWNFMDLQHSEMKGVHRFFKQVSLAAGDDVWIGYETHETA